MSEVKRFYIEGSGWGGDEDPNGDWVLAEDYDALAAQRDEGLAREVEFRKELELVRKAVPNSTLQFVSLQQRLAEAEKLARSLLDEYDEAKQNARQYRPGAVIGLALRFLASPGCSDGEKQS